MKNSHNKWSNFSRCLVSALLTGAGFCCVCALGAYFHTFPWLLVAGAITLMVFVGSLIWGLGYKSREPKRKDPEPPHIEAEEIIPPTKGDSSQKTRVQAYDYETDQGIPDIRDIIDMDDI